MVCIITNVSDKWSESEMNFLASILSNILFEIIQSRPYEQAKETKNECEWVQIRVWKIETIDENKALVVWNTLQNQHPNFLISSYKIVGLQMQNW